jgi:CRP/FNR family transcriptional regulator, cyclic AMP receptor protein
MSETKPKIWDASALLTVMQHAWPSPISQRTADLLLQNGKIVRQDAGGVVVHQGNVPRGIVIMLEGAAVVMGVNANGREFTLSVIFAGEGYGFVPCYTRTPDTTSLIAREPMAALIVPIDAWIAISNTNPDLKDAVIAVMCRRMRWMTDSLEFRSMAPAIAALAHRLYCYAIQVAPEACSAKATDVRIEAQLSQSALASMLSLSRQRTHQLLHKLENDGAIELAYGRIVIRNVSALRRIMDIHETE